ncbi:MAG: ATP-binding cassette domain-containing protein, partial [Selenomonadaceae bacterium]|nr:ATP-binding cassette domain-containing protein [Selenomonadaceae bacterium]
TKFFRKFTSGELAQRMGGIQEIKSLISGEFVATVFNIIFSFWSLFLMCYYSVKLTAIAFVIWIIYCLIMILIYRRVVLFQTNLIEAKNNTSGIVQQIFTGLAKFRIQGAEEQAYYLWSKAFGEEWKWNKKLRWQENYNLIISSIQPFILTMILYYVTFNSMKDPNGGIGYAQFLAFQSAFTGFNATLNSFIPLIGKFFTMKPHIENLRPILDAEPEIAEDRIDADVLTGAIEVNHVTFAYDENLPDVLHDVSFRISAGENVAIVGKSGCGKSTLIRLLLGFEEPKQGAVYYDGQDLAELSLPSVRSQMGVVLQNGQLMTGDIFTNIVGTTALTMEDAWAAAESAGIADDIRKMPMGMQTVISEGSSNISGGQRQRILIARALAAKPSILIFDEATSALDNRTQAIVTESVDKLHATRIVIAHRLSTIRNCDRILVMDKGRLVESGSFDELVAQGGLFAGLVKRQVA